MKYLLDVSALVALGVDEHEFHERVVIWVRALAANEPPEFATCSITELGFVRVLARVSQYGFSILRACEILTQMKSATGAKFTFIVDNHDLSYLPDWVSSPKQLTDGHLLQLAKANEVVLA